MQGQLDQAIARIGYDGPCSVLHPGQQRQRFIRWAISRLLGEGRCADEIWNSIFGVTEAWTGSHSSSDASGSGQLLSEEERLAQRWQQLLGLMGIQAGVDDIRGCSKGSGDLLLQLAGLVAAVDAQRSGISSSSTSERRGGTDSCAIPALAAQQLLESACDLGSRVWCDTMQLFPRDMAPLVEEHRDAAEQLCLKLPGVQEKLHSGSAVCVGQAARVHLSMTANTWTDAMDVLSSRVSGMAEASQQLAGVFEQELSVWSDESESASGKGQQQQQLRPPEANLSHPGLGASAHEVIAGCQDVSSLIEAIGVLMDMHATLQDVPVEWLSDLTAAHSGAAAELVDGSSTLARFDEQG